MVVHPSPVDMVDMHCIYTGGAVFDWDESNLRKIRRHRIKRTEVEEALSNSPILIYEQEEGGERIALGNGTKPDRQRADRVEIAGAGFGKGPATRDAQRDRLSDIAQDSGARGSPPRSTQGVILGLIQWFKWKDTSEPIPFGWSFCLSLV